MKFLYFYLSLSLLSFRNISRINCNKPTLGTAPIITSLRLILNRCMSSPQMNNFEKGNLFIDNLTSHAHQLINHTEPYSLQQREAIVGVFSSGGIEIITNLIQVMMNHILFIYFILFLFYFFPRKCLI